MAVGSSWLTTYPGNSLFVGNRGAQNQCEGAVSNTNSFVKFVPRRLIFGHMLIQVIRISMDADVSKLTECSDANQSLADSDQRDQKVKPSLSLR